MTKHDKSADPITQKALDKAHSQGRETVWARYGKMQPSCGFGELEAN